MTRLSREPLLEIAFFVSRHHCLHLVLPANEFLLVPHGDSAIVLGIGFRRSSQGRGPIAEERLDDLGRLLTVADDLAKRLTLVEAPKQFGGQRAIRQWPSCCGTRRMLELRHLVEREQPSATDESRVKLLALHPPNLRDRYAKNARDVVSRERCRGNLPFPDTLLPLHFTVVCVHSRAVATKPRGNCRFTSEREGIRKRDY